MTNSPPVTNIVPYTITSFGTLLVYDYLCTFADEMVLVWSQPMHVGTVLFFLNRYPPFVDTFMSLYLLTTVQTPETCTRVFKAVTWLIVLGVFTAETILMLRTYAIYERKRWVLILLSIVLAIVVIPGIVVVQMELESLSYGYPFSGPYTGCTFTKPASAIIFIAYVLVVFSETVVVGLTLYKAVHHLRRSKAPLVMNLYRNGLMFYAYILAISLANVIVPVTAHSATLDNWLATPQRVLHSIFCNRILLSIFASRSGSGLVSRTSFFGSSTTDSHFGFPTLGSRHRRRHHTHNSTGYNFTSVLPESSGSGSMLTGTFPFSHPTSTPRGPRHAHSEWDEAGLRVYKDFVDGHEDDFAQRHELHLDDNRGGQDIPLEDMSRPNGVATRDAYGHAGGADLGIEVESRGADCGTV